MSRSREIKPREISSGPLNPPVCACSSLQVLFNIVMVAGEGGCSRSQLTPGGRDKQTLTFTPEISGYR